MGWQGICVERGVGYTEHYKEHRSTCTFLNEDATLIDYKALLEQKQYPKRIDYLSVDIDESSAKVLEILPLNDYRFSIITTEHDGYRFGDTLRSIERDIFNKHSYTLLCSDVLVPLGCGMGPDLPFEDWWVDSRVFDMDKLHRICGPKQYPDDIAKALRAMPDVYYSPSKEQV